MTGDGERPADALRRLINGYQVSQAIHVAATLGIADLLARGPRQVEGLAAETGTHSPSLYRLLRALAAVGVLHEEADRAFRLTEVGQSLRSDAPESLAAWAVFVGRPHIWEAWAHLLHSVRTGENAFRHVHGTDVWSYRASQPEEGAVFDRAMLALTRQAEPALLDAYDFGRFGTVVDVGGGTGAFLAGLLSAHPRMSGVLFDQPHVVAEAPAVLESAGVAARCRIVAGSFFEEVPAGGDAYVLKMIVHDWEDAEAGAILRQCRAAAREGATLLVLERDLGPPNAVPQAKLIDLTMLVGPGGRERTEEEYASLLAAAGFRFVRAVPSAAGISVYEGEMA